MAHDEPIRRILVATDFSEGSERALATAIRFAKLLGASTDLFHVRPMPVPVVVSPVPGVTPVQFPGPELLDIIQERIDEQSRKVQEAGVGCSTMVVDGHPADQIVARANKTGAALIVVGTQGRTGLRRALLGSVAEHVLRGARTPVLVVPTATERAAAAESETSQR